MSLLDKIKKAGQEVADAINGTPSLLREIKTKAAARKKTIVLCEGEDKRVIEAAAKITEEGIAKIVLIGNEEECKKVAPEVDLTGITLVDRRICQHTLRSEKG